MGVVGATGLFRCVIGVHKERHFLSNARNAKPPCAASKPSSAPKMSNFPPPPRLVGGPHQSSATPRAAFRHRKTPRDRRRFGRWRSRSPKGEPAGRGGRIKPSSPSNLPGKPSALGFQPTMTNPERTRPNSGTKAPAPLGMPRKSISETAAPRPGLHLTHSGPRPEATSRDNIKIRCQKRILGMAGWEGMLSLIGISP